MVICPIADCLKLVSQNPKANDAILSFSSITSSYHEICVHESSIVDY